MTPKSLIIKVRKLNLNDVDKILEKVLEDAAELDKPLEKNKALKLQDIIKQKQLKLKKLLKKRKRKR